MIEYEIIKYMGGYIVGVTTNGYTKYIGEGGNDWHSIKNAGLYPLHSVEACEYYIPETVKLYRG